MGKNHRHKKMLKSERAKVKLKVKTEKTKFLPKGLNVTRTDFKIKPIVLPEQLKAKDSADLLSTRKLNVKDILSRLRHHNSTVRHDCLNDMKQLINLHLDDLISLHLAQIMQGLPPLLLDDQSIVRSNVMTILQKLLEKVPKEKLIPFYGILSSYLRCSMTNMNRSIQEDSLNFLKILLQFAPQLIADEKHKVLPNIFALISRLKADSQPTRTLSVNLNAKLTNVKWHIKVLTGIYDVLNAINVHNNDLATNMKTYRLVKLSANRKASKFVPVFHNNYLNNKISINCEMVPTKSEQGDVVENNLTTLITLLYEIWIEVAPEKNLKEFSDFSQLGNDAAAILSCILNVLHLIYVQLLNNHQDKDNSYVRELFFTSECKNFLQSVLNQFPFAKSQEKMSNNNQSANQRVLQQHVQDTNFVRGNLLICYMFCNFNKRIVRKDAVSDANRILKYIEHCLITRGYITKANVDSLLSVLKIVFFENVEWYRKVDLQNILIRFVTFYIQFKRVHTAESNEILDVLCELSQLSHLNSNNVYQTWLGNTSADLEGDHISEKILDALLIVAKQNNTDFLIGLRKRFTKILDNYKHIKIITNIEHTDEPDCANTTYNFDKLKILCLFFYLSKLEQSDIVALKEFYIDCTKSEFLQHEKNIVEQLLHKFDDH